MFSCVCGNKCTPIAVDTSKHVVVRIFNAFVMCIMRAGLWKAYFLPMFKGEITPCMPKEPPNVHIRDRKEVPYTPEEMKVRTAAYTYKKATWDKTMKVLMVCVSVWDDVVV
jgi:hypothetical protein